MKTKTFTIIIISGFITAFLFLFSIMFYINKHYSPDWRQGEITGSEVIIRELKSRYINQTKNKYDVYILGGSKAGFLLPSTFEKYTNNHYYNFYTSVGLFSNYELFSNFLINENAPKEIIIHLSTYETYNYDDKVYIPIKMQKFFFSKVKSILLFFKERYLNINYLNSIIQFQNTGKLSIKQTGEINSFDSLIWYNKDKESYVKQNVLHSFNEHIEELLYNEPHLQFYKKDIDTLKRIKQNCDDNNIELKVVIGAHFISAYRDEYGEDFNNYMRELVSVMGCIWNFCGINDVNKNPYNFLNEGHFWYFTGNKMIERMYSPVPNTTDLNAFGILLTKDNIEEYIQSQKEKWLELKTEYETTETIKLPGIEDESYLGD